MKKAINTLKPLTQKESAWLKRIHLKLVQGKATPVECDRVMELQQRAKAYAEEQKPQV